jgi:hypothetical protein
MSSYIHLYCYSFLKITETEPRFFHSKKTGTEIKCLEPHMQLYSRDEHLTQSTKRDITINAKHVQRLEFQN